MSDETMPPADDNAWGEWGGEDVGTPATMHSQVTAAPGVVPLTNSGILNLGTLTPPRENHPLTLSMTADGKAPMLVLRAETPQELGSLLTQVEMSGLWANIGNHLSSMRAHGTLGAGLGPVQALPQQPMGMPPAPGMPMQPPAPVQQQWGGQQAAPQPCVLPPGWFKVNIPFASRAAGDAVKEQLKAAGAYQGNVRWCAGPKHWHISPNVVAYFQQFGPTQ